ncbi:MAG: FAD-binding and (Fe-S)-binding domain-containing protein [Sporichthyaceae bacterium]
MTDLVAELKAALPGAVEDDVRRRAEYSSDASNYRHVPRAVVFPANSDDVAAAVAIAAAHGVGVTMRGGGTSVGGSSIGPGVVLDCSRRFNRVLEIDPEARLARVEPGLVLDRLRAATAPHGLTFGPDPSTHSRATLGGMIANNACGSHSLAWGRTVDSVESLDVLLADGTRLTLDGRPPADERLRGTLEDLANRYGDAIRTGLGRFERQASGYALQHLLPSAPHWARALVGTEGTCAAVLGATLRLVPPPAARALLVLGCADLALAADAIPAIRARNPLTCEGIDTDLLPPGTDRSGLPAGEGWLLVEFGGATPAEAEAAAIAAAAALRSEFVGAAVVVDAGAQRAIWRIREDGAGLATRRPYSPAGGSQARPDGTSTAAWPGWEDAAVPIERLGSYLTEFRKMMTRHGRRGVLYGHFGDGCLHVRIDFDLATAGGIAAYRSFLEEGADLVAAHGGSCSGEHGDGQSRSELLSRTTAPELLAAFAEFQAAFDPQRVFNPGIVVAPRALDADLRQHRPHPVKSLPVLLSYPGTFDSEVHRCVGVGKCRAQSGGVMCPSFRATGDEKDSTRGRARVLQEMVRGELITDGWRSTEVREALDLCLSCKGCKKDCPVGVDLATYKAEFLHHHYRGRRRPAAHYSLGWLPVWARFAGRVPAAANLLARSRMLRRAGGVALARPLPRFTARADLPAVSGPADGPQVALWVDTFTAAFAPDLARSALDVLVAAGLRVQPVAGNPCCGMTWIHSGQLGVARRVLRRTVERLAPLAAAGVPIVGLEPSCTAALRSDLPTLLGRDPQTDAVAGGVVSLAEALTRLAPDWRPARLPTGPVVAQVHCHQHAEGTFSADAALLRRWGVDLQVLDAGCCGLAGAFGFEAEHYDLSVRIAEGGLLPALAAAPDAVVLADGFSCRTQVGHLTTRRARHLAELLDEKPPQRG